MRKLSIRQAVPERDAQRILALYAPYIEKTAITFETEIPQAAAFERRVAGIAGEYPYLLLEEDGALIGFAYAHRQAERAAFGWNAELSIYMREDCTGRGLGAPLYALLMRLLGMQGCVNLYAVITGSNARSIAMHERMGFVRCGFHEKTGWKSGEWHDTVWLVRRIAAGVPEALQRFDALDAQAVEREIEMALQAMET